MEPAGAGVESMLQGILPLVGAVGAPGLIVLVVLLVLTGRLVPRSVLNERMADKDIVIADLREANQVLTVNNELLRRGNETAVHLTQATAQAVGAPNND